MEVEWLGNPSTVIWALHDESCIPPYRIDTAAATAAVDKLNGSTVLDLKHAEMVVLDL